MKINWGTGIVIAFFAFIGFILFFVVQMSLDDRANHDLVTEDYYKAELGYQKEIDAEHNAKIHQALVGTKKTPEGLLLQFPESLNFEKIKGTVYLYRPSNKHLDFDLPISLSNSHMLIPAKRLPNGRWDIKVFWEYDTEEFLLKKSLSF